ncbi:MAG: ABC transporter substrate-binding protein [bacterium]
MSDNLFNKGRKKGGFENITIQDDAGRKVSIRLPVKRVVTLAPSNTDIIEALGMTSTIVGASNMDDNPLPDGVKRVGFVNPSVEEIVSLKPELVMGIYGEEMLCRRLERLNIPCIILSPNNLEGVMHDIKLTGRLLSANNMASIVVKNMRHTIDLVKTRLAHCKTTPLVYFEVDASDPSKPFSAGNGSFIDSMITMAHAINIAHTINTMWPQLSSEYIIAKNPDIIIMSHKLDISVLRQRPGWSEIKAIKYNRVYYIEANLISRPGPDIVKAFVEMAKDIHPEVFENNNNGTDKSPLPPLLKGGKVPIQRMGQGIIEQPREGTNNK